MTLGINALSSFYHSKNYLDVATAQFQETALQKVAFSIKSMNPLPEEGFFHKLCGRLIVPSSFTEITDIREYNEEIRRFIKDESKKPKGFRLNRIAVSMNGQKIDALIMGTPSSLKKNRWTLVAQPNGMTYEERVVTPYLLSFLKKSHSNALFFNYPSVGASEGPLTKETLIKSHQVMLEFLENNKEGLGAQEVVLYGYSLGGGVTAESAKRHEWKEQVSYCCITDRTFGALSKAAGIFQSLITFFDWELEGTSFFKECPFPCLHIEASSDTVITSDESLATSLKEKEGSSLIVEKGCDHLMPLSEKTVGKMVTFVENSFT